MTDRSEMLHWGRIGKTQKVKSTSIMDKLKEFIGNAITHQLKINLFFSAVGFMLGRAIIIGYLNPFAMAYLGVAALQELNIAMVAISVLIGFLSAGNMEVMLKYIISSGIFAVLYVAFGRTRVAKKILVAVFVPLAGLISGYFIFYVKDYFMYDLLMVIVESIMSLTLIFVYDRAFPVIKKYKSRNIISTEELVAISIMIAFCFVGTEITIGGVSVRNMLVIFLVMMFSYYGDTGAGSAIGMILGLIQSLTGAILPSAIGVYGLCGLLCGAFKILGKAGCPLGFVLGNALMTYYINGSTEVLIKFPEILGAAIIFILIPKGFSEWLQSYKTVFAAEYLKDRTFNMRIKQYTSEKLRDMSGVFEELSEMLRSGIERREYFSQADAAGIIESVVDRTCCSCGMKNSCWQRDFYKSYQNLFNLLAIIEGGGSIDVKDIPAPFKNRCLKPEEVFQNLKNDYDLYKNNLNWENKLNESRFVVSDQFKEVALAVSNLALKVDLNVDFNREMEEQIMVALDDAGILPDDVIVAQSGGTYEIDIRVGNCGGRKRCIKDILPIVNRVTGKKFVKYDNMCNIKHDGACSIKLKEAQKYQVATGVSRVYKSKDKVSGDNYSFIELRDGKFMLALSDGMGIGAKAALESNATITLLEKFLYAGFDRDVAIRTINSLILFRSNEESYATVDMSVINQYNGEVEFVKVGAVSTFIKSGNKVDIIRTSTLPVGILSSVDADTFSRKLKDGDFIIMVTDGILDANKDEVNKEKWLAGIIEGVATRNPKTLADEIMTQCLEYAGGEAIDDMTVMVAKIWETVS